MVARGDLVPHFRATAQNGRPFAYVEIWQKKNLVLVLLPEAGAEEYLAALTSASELTQGDTVCVVTRDAVDGFPRPGAAVADQWGELFFVTDGLPPAAELVEWLDYARMQCPECRGEER